MVQDRRKQILNGRCGDGAEIIAKVVGILVRIGNVQGEGQPSEYPLLDDTMITRYCQIWFVSSQENLKVSAPNPSFLLDRLF